MTAASPRGPTRRPPARGAASAWVTATPTGAAPRSSVDVTSDAPTAPHSASPHAAGDAPDSPTWDAAWASALERAELDAADGEALLSRLHAEPDHLPAASPAWSPLPRLGPLPASMAERAQAVLKRHQRLAEELTVAITENRRQQRASARLSQREAATPVYIDTEA